MSSDIGDVMEKGKKAAQQATEADQAGNHAFAAEAYMVAAKWFIHATKYGQLNHEIKTTIREKTRAYLQRAEELRGLSAAPSPTPPTPAKAAASANGDGADSDLQQEMKRLEGAIVKNLNVSFDDVVGLEQAKIALQEAVILPVQYPRLFRGKRRAWAGILLYGPPGTGKSYLAKAIATECENTFISVTAADLLSKWVGDAEKNVKALFKLARERKPCVIFIDEIDALCSQRNDTQNEAASRVLAEFLVQMDGLGTENAGVLVLGATNLPWKLDDAIRRRFQKRIYITLPELNERAGMLKLHLGTDTLHTIKEHEWMQLAEKAEDYSGADINNVCNEALLRPIRRLTSATHFKRIKNPHSGLDEPELVWISCSSGDPQAVEMRLKQINPDELCDPPVTMSDMLGALATQRRTVSAAGLKKYIEYTQEFGQDGS